MIAVIARPRLIPALTAITGVLIAAYIALIVATILFAALQTQLAQDVQQKHMEIGKLESSYYEAVAQLDATDPHSLGYVTPSHVTYVTAAPASSLTFAD